MLEPGFVCFNSPKKTKAAVMDDFLEGELADINEMFHEFEVKDKKKEQRTQAELEEIEKLKAKVGIAVTY